MLGKFEPVLNSYTISTLVAAVMTVSVAFNVPITDDQRNGVLGLVAAICVIFGLGSVVARNNVYPAAKVDDEIVPEAFRAGVQSARLGSSGLIGGGGNLGPAPQPVDWSHNVTPPPPPQPVGRMSAEEAQRAFHQGGGTF